MKIELQNMLNEADVPDVDPTPNKSTGINVLEQLLKKIIPVLQTDYKSLTTDENQRSSFRAHIVNAIINTLTPAKVNNEAGDEEAEELAEEVDISIGDDDKFIDIRTDSEKKAEEEELQMSVKNLEAVLREMKQVATWPLRVLKKSNRV